MKRLLLGLGLCVVLVTGLLADTWQIVAMDSTSTTAGGWDLVWSGAPSQLGRVKNPTHGDAIVVGSRNTADSLDIKVTIDGLNTDWNRKIETLTLNGLRSVASSVSWLRFNDISLSRPPTGAIVFSTANSAIIGSIQHPDPDSAYVKVWIPAGSNHWSTFWHSIAKNYEAAINWLVINTALTAPVSVDSSFIRAQLLKRSIADTSWKVLTEVEVRPNASPVLLTFPSPIVLRSQEDVTLRVLQVGAVQRVRASMGLTDRAQ